MSFTHSNFASTQIDFFNRFGHLRHPEVRDLAWLLSSEDLFSPIVSVAQAIDLPVLQVPPASKNIEQRLDLFAQQCDAFIEAIDRNPEALMRELALRPTHRIGLYAESLLKFFLQNHFERFRHGMQVREPSGQTLGEFDFLINDGQHTLHLELATKFYIHASIIDALGKEEVSGNELTQRGLSWSYVGPNLNDTLAKKSKKTQVQQLELSQTAAGRRQMDALGWDIPIQAMAWFKGWLFDPTWLDVNLRRCGAFELNLKRGRGGVITSSELQAKMSSAQYIHLPKKNWLAPFSCEAFDLQSWWPLSDFDAPSARSNTPGMWIQLQQTGDKYFEVERMMVVDDLWLERLRELLKS